MSRAISGRTRALAVLALVLFSGFMALGLWQVERRAWKLDLIERVDARVHAAPRPAPGPHDWPAISRESAEYTRVGVAGHFLNDRETLVQAVTVLGGGFWVMTPLVTDEGWSVLVNRGFVPPEERDPATRSAGQLEGPVSLEGLLRLSEPGGGFLRSNDPEAGRWYSRDVTAIAAAQGLPSSGTGAVAPYFIDADAVPGKAQGPVGGLTVISFRNTHLTYALTWFAMAAGTALAFGFVLRDELGSGFARGKERNQR